MTDCRFLGGYLLGIVTVLALDVFEDLRGTWRIGVLIVVAMTGLFLVALDHFVGGEPQGNDRGCRRDPAVQPTQGQRPSDGRISASDSTTGGERSKDTSVAVAASTGTSETKPPGRSEPPTQRAHIDRSGVHVSLESADAEAVTPIPTAVEGDGGDSAEPQPDDLIGVWENYLRAGDGHFNARGLDEQLTAKGFAAQVIDGVEAGAGDHVLIVDPQSADRRFYVLPSFATSPRSVQRWFDDRSDGSLTGTTRRVTAVGEGRWVDAGRFEVVRKGAVS